VPDRLTYLGHAAVALELAGLRLITDPVLRERFLWIRRQVPLPDPAHGGTQLRVLEQKGHVRHQEDGIRFVYTPAVARHAARKSALRHVVETFFDGSPERAVAALLGGEAAKLSDEQFDRIAELIAKARKEGSR
jgi:hypothetical protein